MSKQQIRDWLHRQDPLWLHIASHADIIDQYTKDQSAWVSVDDEPNINQKVLIRIPMSSGGFNIESATYKGNGVFLGCWCDSRGKGCAYRVSEWMPLPLPPTQDLA